MSGLPDPAMPAGWGWSQFHALRDEVGEQVVLSD
jgi:hypothetical protein